MTHRFEHSFHELEVQDVPLKLAAITRAGQHAPVVADKLFRSFHRIACAVDCASDHGISSTAFSGGDAVRNAATKRANAWNYATWLLDSLA
ncbi:MAG: hypothetical protein AAGD43_14815 [Pseudomonadota bacterium]